jgi:O-antigen/teichoic acid export membrane protein
VHETETFGKRAARAARSNVLLSPVIAIAGLASSIVVVRVLTPDAFALYALAIALRGGVQFVADMGFGGASTRAFAELHERGARRQAQRVYIRLAAARAGVVGAFATAVALAPDAFADLLNLGSNERYFLSFLVVIAVLEVAGGLGLYVLTGTFGHSTINKALLAQSVIQPPLVIAAAVLGLGVRGILGAIVVGSSIRAVALTVGSVRAIRRIEDGTAEVLGFASSYTRVASASIVGKVAAWVNSRQVVTPIAFSAVSRPQVAVFSVAYDWVQQVLTLVSGPIYSLLLPVFATRRRDEELMHTFFQLATRSLALVVFPVAALLLAVFPSMAAVILPSAYAKDYADATAFAAIFVPCFALEVVLSGPATAFMLAHDRVTGAYRMVKVVTALLAAAYFATAGIDLLVVAALMMAIRLGSTFALHFELQKRLGLHVEIWWFVRAVLAGVLTSGFAAAVAEAVPGRAADLAFAPVAGLALFLFLVRVSRLLPATDAAIAARVLRFGNRPLRLLTHS